MTHALAGNLLRLARVQAGLSQRALAAACGVAQPTIASIESGARQPSLPTLTRLLAGAGVEMRIRLEPYDDHDDVLERAVAQRGPQWAAAAADDQRKWLAHVSTLDTATPPGAVDAAAPAGGIAT